MSLSTTRQHASLTVATQRLKTAFRERVEVAMNALGVATDPVAPGTSLDDIQAARFELSLKHSGLTMAFNESLDESVSAEWRRRQNSGRSPQTSSSSWQTLSLVDDAQMDQQVHADRIGQTIRLGCEGELQLLDSYIGALMPPSTRPETDRNPLRPDVIGKALVVGVEAISDRIEIRKVLLAQIERNLRDGLAAVYRDIVEGLRADGVQPLGMTVRHVQGPGTEFGHDSRAQGLGHESVLPASQDGSSGFGSGPGDSSSQASGGRSSGGAGGSSRGTVMGQVDQEVMSLIRRLASIGNVTIDSQLDSAMASRVSGPGGLGIPNLISAHREELRKATTSQLDHMVIDVVGSLFDQILSDPKVPPQMARHIARLQLPVLRAALGDATFFSSRKHPVRRFVNRIASLAVAFDDFSEGSAKEFLELVRALVDEIVAGDFDQMETYEEKLDRLEAFIAEQVQRDVLTADSPGAMLNQRELDLLQHQRYMQQMHAALGQVPMEEFLRQFLTQVWSQAIVHAQRLHGEQAEITRRIRLAGRDLILSVQPKGTPGDRQQFLLRLPHLMKDINEGLALIGWPEDAKKAFLSRLLPAHSESLKGKSMRVLDYNLLTKQLDAVMAMPVPKPSEVTVPGMPTPPITDDAIAPGFTAAEAKRVGLVRESAVDWNGDVDIDLSEEPDIQAVDIEIAGMPAIKEPAEPTHGASLADHVQIGFSYRMHFEKAWHKVRLSHISPGRTFFVFTRGKNHSEAISMTARMLYRMCESGRLRAYENAFLIERATARARQQLAALKTGPSSRFS